MGVINRDLIGQLNLPPGFRFFPTDEELVVQYLCQKVAGHEFSLRIIGDVDLYKFDPWVLPGKAVFGEKEWYFFSPRDRKYPNGSRPNRVAGCGYWKATGTDKVIMSKGRSVGVKKALVFYMGKAPQGTKTNWIMHEFRLFDSPRSSCSTKLDDWVLCRIYKKNCGAAAKSAAVESSNEYSVDGSSTSSETSHVIEDQETSLPDDDQKLVLENYGSVSLDWSVLAGLTAGPEAGANGPSQAHGQQESGHVIDDGSATCVPSLSHIDGLAGGFANQRPNNMMWAQNYLNSVDPFGVSYMAPNPVAAFGFRE